MSFLLPLLIAGSFYAGSSSAAMPFEPTDLTSPAAIASADETEVTEGTYPLNPDGKVAVSNINGIVEVAGWDRPEVHLVSKKVASTRERLADLDIKITSRQDLFRVEVDYKRWKGKWVKGDSLYVNFTLMVPRTALVDEVESVNGAVTVSGLTNTTKVSAVNGAVKGTELKGNVRLSTVNGTVTATFDRFESGSEAYLSTVNGTAEIRLPSNLNATVKADSVNGSISNDFGLPVKKGKYVGRDLYGRIGSGGSTVRLNTVNGSIKIKRNDDGMPLNPVENLLPKKTSDDFDDEFDGDQGAAVVRSVREAEKLTLESLKASKEVEREVLRQSEKIVAEAATVNVESLNAALADLSMVELDQDRIKAEVAAATRTLAGNRPAPFILEDSKTIKVSGIPSVEVEAKSCVVTVKGWERDEVKYVVTRLARGRTSPVKRVGVAQDGSEIRINVKVIDPPSTGELLEQVHVDVFVPKKSNLKINTDREIRLIGVTGELELIGMNGGIDIRDAGGSLDVESKDGTVRVIGFDGDLDSRIGSADMYLDGEFRRISSRSNSGKVYLMLDKSHGASIRSNSDPFEGVDTAVGKTVLVNGLRFRHKAEGVWQVGNGESDYRFEFSTGSLIVRPRAELETE